MRTAVPPALVAAYEITRYRVRYQPGFVLRIGRRSDALAKLLERRAIPSAAFMTAWNPWSRPRTLFANRKAQQDLLGDLRWLGCRVLPGFGAYPDRSGRGEPSLLVLGIREEDACDLGRRYSQNAIVFAERDAVPRLVLLRELRDGKGRFWR